MQLYEVDADLFFDQGDSLEKVKARCADPMRQLIDRYGIKGKSVLSIGPGTAHEEYHFLKYGKCNLTLIDIDEHGSLTPYLERLARDSLDAAAPRLKYFIGDFLNVGNERLLAQIPQQDVTYFSSFTPDELRRYSILQLNSRVLKLLRLALSPGSPSWPWWRFATPPFHPVIEEAVIRFLKPGGLLIIQSYYGGPDPKRNPAYLKACQHQMTKVDIDLLEVWHFKIWSGVTLYVMRKRGDECDYPPLKTPLTRFHGRSEVQDSIERIFPCG